MTPRDQPSIGEIALRLLGEPNRKLSTRTQLRFGKHGSVAVEIAGAKADSWYDHEIQVGGGPRDLIRIKGGISAEEIDVWLEREFSACRSQRTGIIATYGYRENGNLVYEVVRYIPKTFRQRRPGPDGRWIYDLKGVKRIPYRLDELRAAPPGLIIYVVEGEKDVDRLVGLGCIATCNSEGAGRWQPHFAVEFRDREVAVIPDEDDVGLKHAHAVAANVAPVARSVRVLRLPGLAEKGDVSDWLDGGGTRERLDALVTEAPLYRKSPAAGALQLVGFDDMRQRLSDGYLIKLLLSRDSMIVLYGDAGSTKTFLTLHLSLCIAAGAECFGRRVGRAGVVYIAAEAGRSIENRVAAAKHEIEFPQTMPFAAIMSPLDLCGGMADVERLVAAIRAADLGVPVGLVVIDTLARTMGAGSKNLPEDMGAFVRAVDELRSQLGAAVLIVHHSGKDASRGARGHSLLHAATDTEIEVTRNGRIATARITKQRDGVDGVELRYALRVIELGYDGDGDLVTSCIIEELPAVDSAPRAPQLSAQQKIALDLLRRAIEEVGELPPVDNNIPANRRAVTEDTWRSYCYLGGITSGDQDAKRQAFRRSASALAANSVIGCWDNWVWPI